MKEGIRIRRGDEEGGVIETHSTPENENGKGRTRESARSKEVSQQVETHMEKMA